MPDNKIIIGLVGQIAAGKGTAAKYLENKYQASVHRFSTILRDVLKRLHLEINRQNLQNLSTVLRKNFGEDILAKVISEDVRNDPNKIIVIDGIRRLADIKYLKKLSAFKMIRIVANPEIRYQRLINRGENEDDKKKTYKEFLAEQKKEADAETPRVMAEAEIEINNDKSLTELHDQIDKIVKL
jgi:dephospho-CoA kinase